MAGYRPGQILRFTYHSHTGAGPEEIADIFKEILVLHPNWLGKMHGIDLKRLTPAEREVLDAIFSPEQRGKPHKLPLVNDILRRMNPVEEVKNPVSFYTKFVKVFIRNKDVYRTYFPHRMLSVTVAKQTSVTGKVINPRPLFAKVGSTPESAQRMELLKQRNKAAQQKKNIGTSVPTREPQVNKSERLKLIKQTVKKNR